MANISVTFQYDLPDDYLAQTNNLKKKGTWTYNGPDKIWAHVNKDDCKLMRYHYKIEEDGGADFPHPIDCYVLEINCANDPLLACLIGAEEGIDHGSLPHTTEELPDGNSYSRPECPAPDHTYEISEIQFDPNTMRFIKPYPWKKPHMSWNGIRQWRSNLLQNSDGAVHTDVPEQVRTAWKEYRNKLRDLPQVHGADSSVVRSLDMSAPAPYNQAGQAVIQLKKLHAKAEVDTTANAPLNTKGQTKVKCTTIIGIKIGMIVSEATNTYFSANTVVEDLDYDDKEIILSSPLLKDISSNLLINLDTEDSVLDIKSGMTVATSSNHGGLFGPIGITEVNVVSVDVANKRVTLDTNLAYTPKTCNLTFQYLPETHPWKIQAYEDPDGKM